MARQTKKSDRTPQSRKGAPRSWAVSLFIATAIVGVAIILSATINPLFGRSVHWDWMAVLAPAGFVALTIAFRRGWA